VWGMGRRRAGGGLNGRQGVEGSGWEGELTVVSCRARGVAGFDEPSDEVLMPSPSQLRSLPAMTSSWYESDVKRTIGWSTH